MTVNRIIEDKELGPLFVRVNARARRLTFRTKEDGIYVTVPPRTSLAEIENAIEQLRPRLKAAIQKQVRKLIDLDYRIDTEFFKLTLVSGQRERFLSRSELGEMQIIGKVDIALCRTASPTPAAGIYLHTLVRKVVLHGKHIQTGRKNNFRISP